MKTDPKRVLYVIPTLEFGGAETQLIQLMEAMQARGWTPTLVTLCGAGPLLERVKKLGIEHVDIGGKRGQLDPRLAIRLARVVRRVRPRVVHSQTAPANLVARAARPLAWTPVLISTAQNMWEKSRARELAYRFTDRLATVTTNVSQTAADRYVSVGAVPADRMRYIPNAIDVSKFNRDATARDALRASEGAGGAFVWLAVGRLTKQKAYPRMFEAFERLVADGTDAQLWVVGYGELHDELHARVAASPARDRIRMLGKRGDVPQLMSAADGYVMSSDWEGLPLVLLEAAACELISVVTDVGGNAELVLDGQTGLVVPAAEATLLTEAMRRVHAMSPAERAAMAAGARQRVASEYDVRVISAQWDALYRS